MSQEALNLHGLTSDEEKQVLSSFCCSVLCVCRYLEAKETCGLLLQEDIVSSLHHQRKSYTHMSEELLSRLEKKSSENVSSCAWC